MGKGKKKHQGQGSEIDQNQTLLKWLKSKNKRTQQQNRIKNGEMLPQQVQKLKAKKTKKIKKDSKEEGIETKSKDNKDNKVDIKGDKKQKNQNQQQIINKINQAPILQNNQNLNNQGQQKNEQVEMSKQNLDIQEINNNMIVEETKLTKKGKGRKKKGKTSTLNKSTKKEQKEAIDYRLKYPQLFENQEISSTQLIFDKYKPEQLQKYRKDHQNIVQPEPQVEQYEEYPAEEKHKPNRLPSEPLADGRRYQVPIKVCTCCNFFGKRHLCAHNLCSKPCPIQHRKTKIRDRYFQRYKHRPKADDYEDEQ